jgi:hypothetical protein
MKRLRDHLHNGALKPDDVPRNRLYPTSAAIGLLLDALKADWKTKVMRATPDYTLTGHLRISLGIRPAQFDQLVREAEARYHFEEILLATRHLIEEYQEEYRAAIARFEAQRGIRVEIDVPMGVSGSRASRERRYVVDGGTRIFCSEYSVYTLQRRAPDSLFLLIQKAGVLEDSSSHGARRLSFVSPTITSLMIDGRIMDGSKPGTWEFRQLALAGEVFSLETAKPGVLAINRNKISVAFSESAR